MLLRAQAAAKANGRDVIEPHDLPITKGLQERIHEFRTLDEEIELQPILEHLAARPPLDLAYGEETEARLPTIAGGISAALARTFKVIDPELKNPQTRHWEMALRILRPAAVTNAPRSGVTKGVRDRPTGCATGGADPIGYRAAEPVLSKSARN